MGKGAKKIAMVIIAHGSEASIATKLIAGTEGKLLAQHPHPRPAMVWPEVDN